MDAPAPFSLPVWMPPIRAAAWHSAVGQDEEADLAIVGAGILGLTAALHAARLGLGVRVIDAGQVGAGASGLNGGQVIPGLKYDPDWLVDHFGAQRGEALVDFAAGTADAVFDLIRSENLAVPHRRKGWIQAAHTQAALAAAHERSRQWQARGANVEPLDAAMIARLTGTQAYLGGWIDRRAGVVNPLAYVMELARVAAEAGVGITENDRVRGLRHENGAWTLTTASGASLRAGTVLVATNAYSDRLVPKLAASIVPLHSFQIATAVLPPELSAEILPGGQAVSDSRRILVYYRRSADGRFLPGGRGRMSRPHGVRDWHHLERAMLRLYPQLAGVPVEQRWYGRVAVTPDHLPHIHMPQPKLFAAVGCQGRGVGLMTALGQRFATAIATGDIETLPLPVTPIRPIPLHALRRIGVAAAIGWYRMLDATER